MSSKTKTTTLSSEAVNEFLVSYHAPIRVSGITSSGYPIICSLWFEYVDGVIWCATQKNSNMAKLFANNPNCAFELSPNEPPYFGVRGQGRVSLQTENAGELLGRLIDKYLETRESGLAKYLLSRVENEVAIRITPEKFFTWDYRERMQK